MPGWRVNGLLAFRPLRWKPRKWSGRCGCTYVRLSGGVIWQVVWCPGHNPFDFRPGRKGGA